MTTIQNRNSVDGHRRRCRLVGMFWLQGESDSSRAKDANAYLANFSRLVEAIRCDLDVPNLPVVVSPVVWPRGKKSSHGQSSTPRDCRRDF
jgi:hypothetical protein